MPRIVIAGVPGAGKTTLAKKMQDNNDAEVVFSTDDLIGQYDWSELSEKVSYWLDMKEEYVIEGVASVRALRKWLKRNPEGKPCDEIYWMGDSRKELSPGQLTMAKGCRKVWNEIREELAKRNVLIETVGVSNG